jgi:hypothetical protein
MVSADQSLAHSLQAAELTESVPSPISYNTPVFGRHNFFDFIGQISPSVELLEEDEMQAIELKRLYPLLDRSKKQTRLLSVNGDGSFSLETFDIGAAPTYTALSYTWGPLNHAKASW